MSGGVADETNGVADERMGVVDEVMDEAVDLMDKPVWINAIEVGVLVTVGVAIEVGVAVGLFITDADVFFLPFRTAVFDSDVSVCVTGSVLIVSLFGFDVSGEDVFGLTSGVDKLVKMSAPRAGFVVSIDVPSHPGSCLTCLKTSRIGSCLTTYLSDFESR